MVVGKKNTIPLSRCSALGSPLKPAANSKQDLGLVLLYFLFFFFFSSQHFNSYSDFDLDSLISFRFQFRLGAPVLLFFFSFFFCRSRHSNYGLLPFLYRVPFFFFLGVAFFSWSCFFCCCFLVKISPSPFGVPCNYLVYASFFQLLRSPPHGHPLFSLYYWVLFLLSTQWHGNFLFHAY